MKWLIALVLILGALFFYPQFNESASTTCAATEKRFARSAFEPQEGSSLLGALIVSGVSNGTLASEFAKNQYPNLPASLGCVVVYYHMMVDPDMPKRVMKDR